jgi:prolipoprotein diacylglyceryltransferase
MPDSHESLFGIMPTILGIPSYSLLVCIGIFAGIGYFMYFADKKGIPRNGGLLVVAAALGFGMIGSKIPMLFEGADLKAIALGKSIVGGFLGGMLGVILIKRIFKIKLKMGNLIAPAAALGMSIGRIGCFLNGCCYGNIASWGFDFGDGNLRLPTQLFEAGFHALAFCFLHYYRDRVKTPGLLFKVYVSAYFIFRFFLELLRDNPKLWLGMSVYQAFCLAGILYLAFNMWRDWRYER